MTPQLASRHSIDATLELSDTAERTWDVVVVGAGPAGALAARQAARLGAAVLLIDKAFFPRWKVCGCCLNAAALSVLEFVGLEELPARAGAKPLERIRLAAGKRAAVCRLPGGVSLSREAFDTALVEAALSAGAHFLPHTEATLRSVDAATFRTLDLRREHQTIAVRSRVVLAADGLSGRLASNEPDLQTSVSRTSRLGAGAVLEDDSGYFGDGVIYMASGRGGYVGLVRLEDGRLDVAAALDREAVRRSGGPGRLAASVLSQAGFPVPAGIEEAAWRGTPPLTRRPARLYSERLMVLGDAAGYVEPFTGEGMAWALAGAASIAPLAVSGAETWSPEVGLAWEQLHHCMIVRRQFACRWVSRLLRRPTLCAAAVTALRAAPQLASPLIHAINRPFAALSRVTPIHQGVKS
ncbi:MAG: FAD-dependent monooxygenase [Planctomycetes bacterium]|nr:FAD-dependent monooxygenase [Planctomycetota bacterium]